MAALFYLVGSHYDIHVDPNATNSTDTNVCWTGTVPCNSLELGLSGLQQSGGNTTLWITAGNYSVNSSETNFKFENSNNLAIVGSFANESLQSETPPVLIFCNNAASQLYLGMTFIKSKNITFRGVGIIGCGTLHNSTSKNFTKTNETDNPSFKFAKFNATLYFVYCIDVTFNCVHINKSFGVGAVFYSTIGNNVIEKSHFYDNRALKHAPGGGGLYIEFSYCVPNTNETYNNCNLGSNVPSLYSHNAQYLVTDSVFDNNKASLVNPSDHTFILPQKSEHLAFGRGGGISVFFKGNATNNTITISNCTLSNNVALWGAGLFVEYQDMSLSNTLTIENTNISNNKVLDFSTKNGTGGGGSRVGFIFFNDTHVSKNTIRFENVKFDQNRAYFGGGLSFYVAREQTATATNVIIFCDCTWVQNVARVGSAVDLAVWHPVSDGAVVRPSFSNCTFSENNANYITSASLNGTFVGLGTLYSDSIPTEFDFVNFTQNSQTALAAVGTGIYFRKNSEAWFKSNVGRNGGAIALMGYAFIEVAENTVLNFVNNSADLKGGAIYGQSIGEHDLISSRNCFIRYSDIYLIPRDWKARFNFENNSVNSLKNKKTNSIFVSSLLTCLWGGAFGSANKNNTSEVFCWKNWNYSGGCSENIETSPGFFSPKVSDSNLSEYHMTVIPGKRKILPFSSFDDNTQNVSAYTVFVARIDETDQNNTNKTKLYLDSSSVYISDNSLEVHGLPEIEGTVRMETVDPRVVSTKVHITVENCPPGMILSSDKIGKNATCTCGTGLLYNGVITCKQDDYTTFLQRGSWIGKINDLNMELLVGQCPFCASIESDELRIPLSNVMVNGLNNYLCEKINRTGILCGKCRENYGPAVNSQDFKCINCTDQEMKQNWFWYLLTEFLPITIFFFIVVLFNISVTSGPANAFVFFAQMVTTAIKLDGDGLIQLSSITPNGTFTYDDLVRVIPYGFWNLNFFRPFLPSFCLSSNITTLQLLSTGYITAFYPLILVAIFFIFSWLYSRGFRPIVCLCRPLHVCFARVTRIWDIQKSIVHALATFLVLSYTKFTQVSFTLLTSTPLTFSNGSTASLRLYYAGDISFGSREHIPYMIPAIIVLCTFVAIPPIILIAPSIIHVLQKWCYRTPDLCGGAWFSQFLNTFHGCYKDGTGGENNKYDCRWFAGMYFCLRVFLLAIFAFTGDWFVQSMLQLAVCIGANLAFVIFRPYKNDLYNKVDAAFFNLIALLCCLSLHNYYENNVSPLISGVQNLLLILPLVYISVVVIHYLWNRNKNLFKKLYQRCLRKSMNVEEHVQNDDDFFQDAEEAGRFSHPDPQESPSLHPDVSVLSDDQTQPLLSARSSTNFSRHQNKSEDSGRSSYGGTRTSAGTQTSTDSTVENSEEGQLIDLAKGDSSQRRKSLFFTQ